MHYYVVGVNAVGKSSLLKAISEQTGVAYVHGTAVLMERLGIPGDYNALRALDQADVLKVWEQTARNLVSEYGERSFMLDTHILNLTNGKTIRRDGPWIAEYDCLVLVTAPAEEIFERIKQDTSRDRALFGELASDAEKFERLREYQSEMVVLFDQLAKDYGLRSIKLNNLTGQLETTARQFIEQEAGNLTA